MITSPLELIDQALKTIADREKTIAELEATLAEKSAENAHLLAETAVLRESLAKYGSHSFKCWYGTYDTSGNLNPCSCGFKNALSIAADTELLERIARLEKVAEAARKCQGERAHNENCPDSCVDLTLAISELDALEAQQGDRQ